MKLGANIKCHQMMWVEKESQLIYIFAELCPFEIISTKIMFALQLINRQRYFHETGLKNKLVSDNVQKTRTVTPPTICEIRPL